MRSTTFGSLSVTPLPAMGILLILQSVHAEETYAPTPGFDRVKELVARLEHANNRIPGETRRSLLARGKVIIRDEEQDAAGTSAIQQELKKADETTARLEREWNAIQEEIRIFNITPGGTQQRANELSEVQRNKMAEWDRHNQYINGDLNPRIDADNKRLEDRNAAFIRDAEESIRVAQSFGEIAKDYQGRRELAKSFFKDKENYPARCAVVLSAALDLRPDSGRNEKSLADIDERDIDPAYRGKQELKQYYVQAQQLADRLARDWRNTEQFNDWETARAKVGGRKGVLFFRDADWRRRDSLRPWEGPTGDHIDIWDGAKTGSGYSFRKAEQILFWEIKK